LAVTPEKAKLLLKNGKSRFGTLTGTLENLKINRELFFEEIVKRVEMEKYLKADPSVKNMLTHLRGSGLRIGLVSNSGRPVVLKILSTIGLAPEEFDVVVTSSDAKPKPSPEPFLLAIRKIGSDVEHSVYVGDRDAEELQPAKKLGIKTILVDQEGHSTANWADYVVRSLSELPELMKKLGWTS
jgi:HAD superfamily hydrolase (TIGR01509 family)